MAAVTSVPGKTRVRVFAADTGVEIATLDQHGFFVFSPDGSMVATLGLEGLSSRLDVLGVPGFQRRLRFDVANARHAGWFGRDLLTAVGDKIVMWDPTTGKPLREIATPTFSGRAFAVSSRGVVSLSAQDRTVRSFDLATGTAKRVLRTLGTLEWLAYSPDGYTLRDTTRSSSCGTRRRRGMLSAPDRRRP